MVFVKSFSDNISNKLIYTIALSSYKGLDFWRLWTSTDTLKGNLQGGIWPIENHVAFTFCLVAFSTVAFFRRVHVFISCLKNHLFFNHVVNRTGLFFSSLSLSHFCFYTSQLTIDLSLQSQRLFEHHPDATREKLHILTSSDSLRYI